MKLTYKSLDELTSIKIEKILNENNIEELLTLPLSIGEYLRDWKEAQDICIQLANHNDPRIRANAVLDF